MGRSLFFQQVCASVLATLVLWTPFSVTVVRAQERSERVNASEAVQAASSEGVAHGVVSETMSAGDALEEASFAEDLKVHESAFDGEDAIGDDGDLSSEAEGEEGKTPQTSVVPLNLPSGPSKTAVTSQQISLPKGEGSIEGMGESFTPNLSSGTGTFSVPIALPKGRAGVQPSLALSYATSGGNGIVGIGWSLAVPFISRQTDKGLPHYVDQAAWHGEEDTFMYNGGQELVPIDSAAATRMEGAPVPDELSGWQQYRARVEGGFMRFFRAPDASRWVVQSKDGTRFDFGGVGAVTADPEDVSRVFSWQLSRMSDAHGSTVHYRYTSNAGALYPDAIYYTSPASCASDNPEIARECAASLSDYAHRVQFVYEPREDVTSSYVTTWRVEQALRLKRLEITSAADQVGARFLVRRYHLSYAADSYHSLLSSVQVEGRPSRPDPVLEVEVGNAAVPEASLGASIVGDLLPPMRFGYTKPTVTSSTVAGFGGIDATVHKSGNSPDHSTSEGRVDLFDVNSDGLPDLLVTDPARYDGGAGVYFNGFPNGVPGQAGAFSEGVRVDIPAGLGSTLSLSNLNILPMDVDGDGRVDVLHMPRAANYGYFVLSKEPTPAGAAYAPLKDWSFHRVTNLLPAGVTDPRIDLGKDGLAIKTLDVNNDHLIDIVHTSGSRVQTWLNLGRYPGGDGRFGSAVFAGSQWTLSTLPVESCLPFAGRSLDFAETGVRIADMNGDGLQDIAKVTPDSVVWWPGRGEGAWGDGSYDCDKTNLHERELRMENPPQELNAELAGLHLVDINQDGATDLLQVGFTDLSVWFNQGGTAFTQRIVVKGSPTSIDALERVRIADIDGSATTDIVYGDAKNFRWIDPMGGVRPRLLNQVDNGLGALTTLAYSSSIVDYLRDLSEATACDPADLDCFTWQREPVLPGEREGDCDARVLANSGECVHRAGGSPVVSTVVRSVSTSDRLNALGAEETVSQTEYRYHDGYYEGMEQEFRGFGAADAVALGDEYEPTSNTRTYFHQGRRPNDIAADRLADNPNEALKGREFLTEVYDDGGRYLKTSHATYAVRKLFTGLNDVAVSYAYVKGSDEFRYDTARGDWRPAPTLSIPSVVREQAGLALSAVVEADARAGDAYHDVKVRSIGRVRLSTSIDVVDNVGNLRKQTAHGRGSLGEYGEVPSDERIVQVSVPVRITDALCGSPGWLWRTAESWTQDPVGIPFGRSQVSYTPCGDVRMTTRAATLPPATGALNFAGDGVAAGYTHATSQESASSTFDTWGQPTASCGGADIAAGTQSCLRLGQVTYDAAYQQLVVQEATATGNSAVPLLTTTATWDRGLGMLRTATDPNGNVSEVSVDGLGRLTSTVAPAVTGCEGTRVPSVRIAYALTANPASQPLSRVTTTTLLSCGSYNHSDSQIIAHAYVDGLGRPRASLSEGDTDYQSFDEAVAHRFRLSRRQLFSRKGQVRLSYQASYFDYSADDYSAVLRTPGVPYKRAIYDAFGRPTLSINEDGTYSSISYHALSTDVCDEVDNGFGGECNTNYENTCTTLRTDGHGRAIDQQLRQVTLDGKREQHRLFSYYRADGAVVRVVRALTGDNVLRPESGYAGLTSYVERRFHYDSLGRRLASEDPDTDNRGQASLASRTWRYLFNPVGDLAAVRDPRGCGQNFYYDLAGRLIGETYVSCTEAQAGELASADVPSGSVSLGLTTGATRVHVRTTFDDYPTWAVGTSTGVSGVRGRLTTVEDRGQRTSLSYDLRGNAVSTYKELAVIAPARALTSTLGSDGRPVVDGTGETAAAAASVAYAQGYRMSTVFDHANRVLSTTYPGGFAGDASSSVQGRMRYDRTGAPSGADVVINGVTRPVVSRVNYTRDGLPYKTVYGDGVNTGRAATESRVTYDSRRRPVDLYTTRTPAAGSAPETLSAVTTIADQRLSWDGSSNLCVVQDWRAGSEWPAGHKPYDQHIFHDALYRVGQVEYTYRTPNQHDSATDWREEEDRHRAADPMKSKAAPMAAAHDSVRVPHRVMSLQYSHDWLANNTSWHDDANVFYERSIGSIVNGADLSSNSAMPADRPSALYLAVDLDGTGPDLGGWLETDYGVSGNVLGLTVHAQCGHAPARTCANPTDGTASARRTALRTNCACASEQHYVYRYDELNRLHEARRYDRAAQGAWTIGARQRYRYDGANQRTVKQSFDVANGSHRVALYVYPGDFERRGMGVAAGSYASLNTTGAVESVETPPSSGLYHWYRADSCPYDPLNSTSCTDRAGNTNATNGVPSRHPLVDRDGINGQPALTFKVDSAALGANPTAQTPIATEYVISFVAAIDEAVFQYPVWYYDTAKPDGSRDRIALGANGASSPPSIFYQSVTRYAAADQVESRITTPIVLGQPFVATIVASATATQMYLNGALVGTSGPANPAVMAIVLGGQRMKRIAELLMYSRALDSTELAALHRYQGARYRIAMQGTNAGPSGGLIDEERETETHFMVAGARVVWKSATGVTPGAVDPKHRVTFAVSNLIQSTSAVVDLMSGELVEAGGFYPNGAREEWLGADEGLPLETVGFTGKEADEEVGLVYFGQRYLISRVGRWATPDPLSIHAMGGGEAGNSYHYVSGNLLQARDPLGLDPNQSVPESTAVAGEDAAAQMSVDPSLYETTEQPSANMSVCASSTCRTGTQSDALPTNVPTRKEMFEAHREGANKGMINGTGILWAGKPPEGNYHPDTVQAAEQRGHEAGVNFTGVMTVGLGLVGLAMKAPPGAPVAGRAPSVPLDEGAVVESATAGEFSPIVEGGGLSAHEGTTRGHTIAKHVGQTEAQLDARLAAQPNLRVASSFTSRAQAEAAGVRVMGGNTSKISQWLQQGPVGKLELDGAFDGGVCRVPGGYSTAGTGARFVLKADGAGSYFILTGFPTP